MRNKRLHIIGALLFLQALSSIWGTAGMLTSFGLDWSLCLILVASLCQLIFAATVGLAGESSSAESRRYLAWSWSAGLLILALPALFGLLQVLTVLGTLWGFLNGLCLVSALAALAYFVRMISSFLKDEKQHILLGARAAQQMFSIMVLLGCLTTLAFASDDLMGIKVSITLSGSFFYGFGGWKVWNVIVLILSLALLASRKTQAVATWGLSVAFLVLPFLAGPAFQDWAASMGMGIDNSLQEVLVLLPTLVIGLLWTLKNEVKLLEH